MRLILCLSFVLLFPSLVFSGVPDEKLHQQCIYPTVLTVAGGNPCGTGVVVRSTKVGNIYYNAILTCDHVTPGLNSIRIPKYKDWSVVDGYEEFPAIVYSKNSKSDMAVLICETPHKLQVAQIDLTGKQYIGNDITKVGCGLGDDPRLDLGKITGVGKRYRANCPCVPGDSGGPVFDNANRLIGLCQAVRTFDEGKFFFNSGYVVPITILKSWNETENNALSFVYNSKSNFPVFPKYELKYLQTEIIVGE